MLSEPEIRLLHRGDRPLLALTRRLPIPLPQVWSALIEPERTARWIGPWRRDATGALLLQMSAEEGAPEQAFAVERFEPGSGLAIRIGDDAAPWHLEANVTALWDGTRLTLRHVFPTGSGPIPAAAAEYATGWAWYLDRLTAYLHGEDPEGIAFDLDPVRVEACHRGLISDTDGI